MFEIYDKNLERLCLYVNHAAYGRFAEGELHGSKDWDPCALLLSKIIIIIVFLPWHYLHRPCTYNYERSCLHLSPNALHHSDLTCHSDLIPFLNNFFITIYVKEDKGYMYVASNANTI